MRRSPPFVRSAGGQFSEGAALSPANLIDSKRFEVETADAAVCADPEHSYMVETRVIDGKRYLLLPAGEEVEVNGMPMDWIQRERE